MYIEYGFSRYSQLEVFQDNELQVAPIFEDHPVGK